MTHLTNSQKAVLNYLESNDGAYSNSNIAAGTGFSITSVSSSANRLYEQKLIKRVAKGVWAAYAEDAAPNSTSATLVAMDHALDEKNWFEVKQTRVSRSPAGYDYHNVVTRDGRTGIVVWDA